MSRESTAREPATRLSLSGFALPTWHGPFNVEEHLSKVPPRATVKGMYWNDLYKLAPRALVDLPPGRYSAFGDYPLVDYMRAVALVARNLHPEASVAEGVRRVGRRGFNTLASSLVGRVLFALAGRDLQSTLGLVSQAYRRSLDPGDAQIELLERNRAVISLRSIWNFPTSYQVGVFEGAIDVFGHTGTVQVRPLSACDADFLLEWQ